MKKIITCVVLFFITAIIISIKAQTQLTPDEFENKLTATRAPQLIDVRTPSEYREGHLAKSKNIDYKGADFEEKIKSLDKDTPVFVYCLSGGRSSAAAKKLAANGFNEVYDLKGGYLKWSSSGKKAEGATNAAAKGMSMNDFRKLTSSSKVVFIDFYAKWCEPCIKMLPIVTKLKSDYQGRVTIETINYDANKSLAKELSIEEIPAFLLYKDGKLFTRKTGLMEEKEFRELLDTNL